MGRSIESSKLTKQAILDKVSQVTIFATYLNISDRIVQHCIDTGELICSPLRDDRHPTCGFRYDKRGKLKFRDFAGFHWGDCFDVVATVMSAMYNKTYDVSNKDDFIKVLRHITFTFKDIFYGEAKDINMINAINTSIDIIKHKKPKIEVVVRDWNRDDVDYWRQFGVSLKYLNTHFVYPVEQYYIERKTNPYPKYFYKDTDPCYAYNLGRDRNGVDSVKLYFPGRSHGSTRFITNCNHLEGIYNLERDDYDIIVLTKSTKDRLAIGANVAMNPSLYGESTVGGNVNIGVINVPHETYRLRQNEFDWLKGKLKANGRIVSLMDNDVTGKVEAIWLRQNYAIVPLLIPKESGAKDFAELINKCSFLQVKNYITNAYKYIQDYGIRAQQKLDELTGKDSTLPY